MPLDFEMRRPKNAISQFSAAFQLFAPVTPATFSQVVEALQQEARALNLPAQIPIQTIFLNIGGGNQPQQSPPTGVGFQRFSPSGEVAMSLLCDANSATLTLTEYTSWVDLRPLLVKTFAALLSRYILEVPALSSIKLQYNNAWRARNPSLDCASQILKVGSSWIAPFGFEARGEWHSRSGMFISQDGNERDLVNVDITAQRVPNQNGIFQLHLNMQLVGGCFFNIPSLSPLMLNSETLEETITSLLEKCHLIEKRALADTLSEPYLSIMSIKHDY